MDVSPTGERGAGVQKHCGASQRLHSIYLIVTTSGSRGIINPSTPGRFRSSGAAATWLTPRPLPHLPDGKIEAKSRDCKWMTHSWKE
ncbi:hypothetical protein GCM10010336_19030 [Streptomyces goshikiensis]|nr:hypothetical protein GCM10010336_19030 [Streptomyces goshikiensis]